MPKSVVGIGIGIGLVWFGWGWGEGDVLLMFFLIGVVEEYSRGFES